MLRENAPAALRYVEPVGNGDRRHAFVRAHSGARSGQPEGGRLERAVRHMRRRGGTHLLRPRQHSLREEFRPSKRRRTHGNPLHDSGLERDESGRCRLLLTSAIQGWPRNRNTAFQRLVDRDTLRSDQEAAVPGGSGWRRPPRIRRVPVLSRDRGLGHGQNLQLEGRDRRMGPGKADVGTGHVRAAGLHEVLQVQAGGVREMPIAVLARTWQEDPGTSPAPVHVLRPGGEGCRRLNNDLGYLGAAIGGIGIATIGNGDRDSGPRCHASCRSVSRMDWMAWAPSRTGFGGRGRAAGVPSASVWVKGRFRP